MLINWVGEDRGWLFADIVRHAVRVGKDCEHEIISSGCAAQADAWIYLRPEEAVNSPDLSRTVVQIHDLFSDPPYDYGPESPRGIAVRGAGALCFTHAAQARLVWNHLEDFAAPLIPEGSICRPIGALEAFTPRTKDDLQEVFTVGWAGRPVNYHGRDLKRVEMFVEAIKLLGSPSRVVLIGEGLVEAVVAIQSSGPDIDLYARGPDEAMALAGLPSSAHVRVNWEEVAPAIFRRLDAFVATSESPAVPLACYEALASGVPVVSTPREWPVGSACGLFTADSASEIATDLLSLMNTRHDTVRRSAYIAATFSQWTLEGWCEENIRLAVGLAAR